MQIEGHAPDPRLASVVTTYQSRTAQISAGSVRIPLQARTDVILEFYFTTPHLVEFQATGERDHAPWSVVVGPQTWRRVNLLLAGRLDVFTVRLRPTGLHRLFGAPMHLFTNQALETEHLFGQREAAELHERLGAASTLLARSEVMDHALLRRMKSADSDPIAIAANGLHLTQGGAALRNLIAASGLSARQFRRAFEMRVGTSPKLYSRIVRMNAAIEAKTRQPSSSWAEIAHEFGWFDQAHLDKDFLALAGASPTSFAEQSSVR